MIALVDPRAVRSPRWPGSSVIGSEYLRGWYRRAKPDQGDGGSGEPAGAAREERERLRKEVRTPAGSVALTG
ncbi:hypothetical protein ACH5AO_36750 [Streptomyces sp. NPDC018964]|uniref:hypothetical protein n=1 Tax=Streptomyces sp. NPDC018964 TaxID=3365058 RepID=UPI003796022C